MIAGRRDFLKMGGALAAATLLPEMASARDGFIRNAGDWRTFEVVTRLDIAAPRGRVRGWVPVPSLAKQDWFEPFGGRLVDASNAVSVTLNAVNDGLHILQLEWADGEASPYAEVARRFAVRDRVVDLGRSGSFAPLSAEERALYTAPTTLIRTDGIVKDTADRIIKGVLGDLSKAKAIYDWVVENTFRDSKIRGCGLGDVASMLKMGDLKGKCADLNALYVALARASGLPARDIYGIRVAPSKYGYKSLGANSPTITKAQHCRAEIYLEGFGWVPADPADVRKVALEEPPGNLPLSDMKVLQARATLFGAWEGNWLPYNMAHDVALPGAKAPPLPFFMYPQAEMDGGLLDCLEPDSFKYTITARALGA